MATPKCSISMTIPAGSVFSVGSFIAAGSFVGTVNGNASFGFDRAVMRPVVGSAVWTDDPSVNATQINASVGGIPIGAADSTLPIIAPGLAKNLQIKALGNTVLNVIVYEGGVIAVS